VSNSGGGPGNSASQGGDVRLIEIRLNGIWADVVEQPGSAAKMFVEICDDRTSGEF